MQVLQLYSTGPVVEFSEPVYTTNESSGTLEYTLVSSAPHTVNYEVRVRLGSGRGRNTTGELHNLLMA